MAVTKRPLLAPVWAETGETVRPTDAEISEGWPLSATPPSRQRFNWILGWLAQSVAYLRQSGIPLWDPEESYPADAVVIHSHGLWVSKRKNTNVAPGTSPDDWAGAAELLAGSGGVVQKIVAGTGVNISPPEGTGEVTISATGGSGVKKIVAGTGVTVSPVDGTGEVTISATGGGSGGGVGKIIAGAGVTISPSNGTGDVTISASGGGGVTPPPPPDPNGGVMDYGGWRIMMGRGNTVTGYMDPVQFEAPFDGVFAISITEGNAHGWGAPGAGDIIPAGPTVFGWTVHPTDPNNKFLISVALKRGGEFVYAGGVTFSYIAYGKKPE